MRDAFVKKLTEQAADDPRIMLLVGDLGFGVVAAFGDAYPDQFLNCGVAEQSMVGVAAGLAASGRRPFVYSIANFPTLRPLEQVRNDVCYHGLGVTIVSVGAGLAYGSLGYTHHAVEDISIMRSLPGMRVYSTGRRHGVPVSRRRDPRRRLTGVPATRQEQGTTDARRATRPLERRAAVDS